MLNIRRRTLLPYHRLRLAEQHRPAGQPVTFPKPYDCETPASNGYQAQEPSVVVRRPKRVASQDSTYLPCDSRQPPVPDTVRRAKARLRLYAQPHIS